MRNIDFRVVTDRIFTAFAYGLGVAAAKWITTIVSIRGFNLNF